MKKLLIALLFICIIPLAIVETADAQWALGANYELRNEKPTNGFGVRVDRQILSAVPVVDLGLRAHFSYFSEENSVSRESVTYDREFESYDYGLAAHAGIGAGLLKPYVGVGVGMDQSSLDEGGSAENSNRTFDETDFYFNAFIGSEIRFPVVSPFIEYRFSRVTDREDIELSNISRIAVGLSLRF